MPRKISFRPIDFQMHARSFRAAKELKLDSDTNESEGRMYINASDCTYKFCGNGIVEITIPLPHNLQEEISSGETVFEIEKSPSPPPVLFARDAIEKLAKAKKQLLNRQVHAGRRKYR